PSHPAHPPADNLPHIPAQPDCGANPAHPPVDVKQSPNFTFADDGSPHSAYATGDGISVQWTPADTGHHSDVNPEINLASIPQTATDGAHPADLPVDVSQLVSFKFADDGGAHPGTIPNDPTALTALSSGLSGTNGPAPPTPSNNSHFPRH